jgi:hypothetical protein
MSITPSSYLANTAYPPSDSPGLIGANAMQPRLQYSCDAARFNVRLAGKACPAAVAARG